MNPFSWLKKITDAKEYDPKPESIIFYWVGTNGYVNFEDALYDNRISTIKVAMPVSAGYKAADELYDQLVRKMKEREVNRPLEVLSF